MNAITNTVTKPLAAGTLIAVQIGNPGDSGKYRGQFETCRVLGTRSTFNGEPAYLVEIVSDTAYLCDAYCVGTRYVTTNARVIDEGRWSREACYKSLGYQHAIPTVAVKVEPTIAVHSIGDLVDVTIGNPTDSGRYRGQAVKAVVIQYVGGDSATPDKYLLQVIGDDLVASATVCGEVLRAGLAQRTKFSSLSRAAALMGHTI